MTKTLEKKFWKESNFEIDWLHFDVLIAMSVFCNVIAFGITTYLLRSMPDQYLEANTINAALFTSTEPFTVLVMFIVHCIKMTIFVVIYILLKRLLLHDNTIKSFKFIMIISAIYFVFMISVYDATNDIAQLFISFRK